ncbi:MAG: hypothetical protein IJZ42_01670 [Lachnospiraceae bacterium]|nr:hypothetical protein [Lachnospiraceae bacterium]
MKKFLKAIKSVFDVFIFIFCHNGSIAAAATAEGLCNYSGQGREPAQGKTFEIPSLIPTNPSQADHTLNPSIAA